MQRKVRERIMWNGWNDGRSREEGSEATNKKRGWGGDIALASKISPCAEMFH